MEFETKEQLAGAFRATWYLLHTIAYHSRSKEQASDSCFGHTLRTILLNFFCETCRPHALEYIERIPYSIFQHLRDDSGSYIGPFLYIHNFHNDVNRRLGKSETSFDDALQAYGNGQISCSQCRLPNLLQANNN